MKKASCTAAATRTLCPKISTEHCECQRQAYNNRQPNMLMMDAFLARVTCSCAVIPSSSVTIAASVMILRTATAVHHVNCSLISIARSTHIAIRTRLLHCPDLRSQACGNRHSKATTQTEEKHHRDASAATPQLILRCSSDGVK